jgi:hypothetical protein
MANSIENFCLKLKFKSLFGLVYKVGLKMLAKIKGNFGKTDYLPDYFIGYFLSKYR